MPYDVNREADLVIALVGGLFLAGVAILGFMATVILGLFN